MPIIKIFNLPQNVMGRTKHTVDGKPMPAPAQLKIAQIDGDPGFYIFYCDADGNEMNDTYFDSLEQAKEQAQWEFGVALDAWQDPENTGK